MKKITARMIRAQGSCYNPTELDGVDNKTAWTLLEWMNYKHYKDGADDAIWVFSKMADIKTARRFAIWCAKRCKTNVIEIKEYIKAIEGHYLNGTHTADELRAAYWAAYELRVADLAAYWAADWKKERKAQLAKIKRMLKNK